MENNLKKIFVTESFCCTPEAAQYRKSTTLWLKNSIPLSTLLTLCSSRFPMSLSEADILPLVRHRLYLCCEGSRPVLKAEGSMRCKTVADPGGGEGSVSIRGVSCRDRRTTDVPARVEADQCINGFSPAPAHEGTIWSSRSECESRITVSSSRALILQQSLGSAPEKWANQMALSRVIIPIPCLIPIHFEKVCVYFSFGCTRASSAGGGGLLIAEACCRARPPRRMRIRSCAHGLSRLGTQVSLLCGMWHLPRPGIKLMSPGLQGRFLTPGPPREAPIYFLIWTGNMIVDDCLWIWSQYFDVLTLETATEGTISII